MRFLERFWRNLPCLLFGHIYFWENNVGRVCIGCGRVEEPDWMKDDNP